MGFDHLAIHRIFIAVALVLTQSGCASVWHLEDVVTRVARVESDIAEMKKLQADDQQRLDRLHKDMVEAEETLRRSGAHLGDDMDAMKLEAARLKSADEELRFSLSRTASEVGLIKRALSERLGVQTLDIPEDVLKNPEKLLAAAQDAFDSSDDRRAIELCGIAIARYPDGVTAARATNLLGEIAFRAQNWATAVREFQRVHNYSKTLKEINGNQALLRIGEALEKQGSCAKAIEIYQFLVDQKSRAAEEKTAETRIKKLKKTCR
ncbi:MAG TPA: tetratricopeptide repeat protein [Myxococcota bacterium]|nr:tetratricopeptide repeat protein [Myxococcota bacterium]HOC98645.1 tetratricopeptide repeat protein [Myxococcota bacterium]HOH77480.1 tetratricopeptide repeat protein [Myxococcota bacterium]